jgi:hypothetical protein
MPEEHKDLFSATLKDSIDVDLFRSSIQENPFEAAAVLDIAPEIYREFAPDIQQEFPQDGNSSTGNFESNFTIESSPSLDTGGSDYNSSTIDF